MPSMHSPETHRALGLLRLGKARLLIRANWSPEGIGSIDGPGCAISTLTRVSPHPMREQTARFLAGDFLRRALKLRHPDEETCVGNYNDGTGKFTCLSEDARYERVLTLYDDAILLAEKELCS